MDMRCRAAFLVATIGAVMVLASGMALAANVIRCEPGSTFVTPCEGTQGDDEMYGATSGSGWPDVMRGKGGDDVMYGYVYGDTLYGEGGNDTLYGGIHDDDLWGGAGDDTLYGSLGNDRLLGGPDADVLDGADPYDGELLDVLRGGDGADLVKAQDGRKDKIDCGGNAGDGGYWDEGLDIVVNCGSNLATDPLPQ